jgi:hypothetical protein
MCSVEYQNYKTVVCKELVRGISAIMDTKLVNVVTNQ